MRDWTEISSHKKRWKTYQFHIACLGWFQDHLPAFDAQRREIAKEWEKRHFFKALIDVAKSGGNQMELFRIADAAYHKFSTEFFTTTSKQQFSDVILISLNKNQQHVKAVAANSHFICPIYADKSINNNTIK